MGFFDRFKKKPNNGTKDNNQFENQELYIDGVGRVKFVKPINFDGYVKWMVSVDKGQLDTEYGTITGDTYLIDQEYIPDGNGGYVVDNNGKNIDYTLAHYKGLIESGDPRALQCVQKFFNINARNVKTKMRGVAYIGAVRGGYNPDGEYGYRQYRDPYFDDKCIREQEGEMRQTIASQVEQYPDFSKKYKDRK